MKHRAGLLICLIAVMALSVMTIPVQTQTADYVISHAQTSVDGDAEGIGPGDIVCFEAGTRTTRILLKNFNGTAANPIIIQNCNGKTTIDVRTQNNPGYSIAINNSNHFRLTGSGHPDHEYGIVTYGGTMGVTVGGLSGTGIEIDHINANFAEFASFMVKTDPNCDPTTWRENFVMQDVYIHHNYAYHPNDGEGFYIGFTFSSGYDITCDGQQTTVYGHLIENLNLHDNIAQDTGAEGIQVSSAPDANIYNNVVYKAGQRPFAQFQNNGIQIGYENVNVYSNWVRVVANTGIIVFGPGHRIYNNLVTDVGGNGIFGDDRTTGDGIHVINNTIVRAGNHGIYLLYNETTPAVAKNNLIVTPGDGYLVYFDTVDDSNNLNAVTLANAGFVDPANNNYQLAAVSDAVDAGADVSSLGITTDMTGTSRPQGDGYDIGAFERIPPTPVTRLYPADTESITGGPAWPRFTFEHNPDADWYRVWIGNTAGEGSYGPSYYFQWVPAFDTPNRTGICDSISNICTLPVDLWLKDGDYAWWMTYYNSDDIGNQFGQRWTKTTFTVGFGEIPPINRTDVTTTLPGSIQWTYDDAVLWYRVWLGPADYSTNLINQWYTAEEVCTGATCSINTSQLTFPQGDYEWWMEAWGPGEYDRWAVNGSLDFSQVNP